MSTTQAVGFSIFIALLALPVLGILFLALKDAVLQWRNCAEKGDVFLPLWLGGLIFSIILFLGGCAFIPHYERANPKPKKPDPHDCLFISCPWGQTCSFEDKGPFLNGKYQCKANT
jgi:hypothetical protein